MKRILLFVMFFILGQISCRELPQPETCYRCVVVTVVDYCAIEGPIDEINIVEEELKCNWTEEEIRQYECKSTFEQEEKCFTLVQICQCHTVVQ